MATATGSSWIWDPIKNAYWNPRTETWGVLADGEWSYSKEPPASAVNLVDLLAQAQVAMSQVQAQDEIRDEGKDNEEKEEEELDGAPIIPQEQIWPGSEGEEEENNNDGAELSWSHVPLLRFVVSTSSILPQTQQIALADPASTLSFGRDRSFEQRVRLPELPVSKTHAMCFWLDKGIDGIDRKEGCWAITDVGSTHGTWILPDGEKKVVRLSSAKVASGPRELKHMDSLSIGGTTFTVHLHSSFACQSCSVRSDSSNIIPLLSNDKPTTSNTSAISTTKTKAEKEEIRRQKMRGLRDEFLKPSPSSSSANSPSQPDSSASSKPAQSSGPVFIDRAKARRLRTAAEKAAALPTPSSSSTSSRPQTPTPSPFFTVPGSTSASTSVSSQPSASPFSASSKGALLLSKLTKPTDSTPSAGNGSGNGLGTLIQARTFDTSVGGGGRESRPGLGSRPLIVAGEQNLGSSGQNGGKRDWREDVKEASRKRFREMGTMG